MMDDFSGDELTTAFPDIVERQRETPVGNGENMRPYL
jgi:hypothetical protein